MKSQNNMRLCGGTFLVLLFEARGTRRNSRMGEGRMSDGKSNTEIFKRLIYATNPYFQMPSGRSFNTFTSDYKNCRKSDTVSVNLTDDSVIQQFDAAVKTNYYEHVGVFYNLLENSISWETKGPWLVVALIDLIENDTTIPNDALFYVRPYGQTVQKSELRNIECICIISFVFGVWHYIVTNIKDNSVGTDTINYLLNESTEFRAERKFSSDIGKETITKIKTSVHPPECEWKYYDNSALEKATKDMPFSFIAPNTAVDVRNIINGQIFVDGKQVFYLDGKKHDTEVAFEQSPFDTYLNKGIEFYSKVKTLLYSESPRIFRDFYVPNDVTPKGVSTNYIINENTIPIEEIVFENQENIIIQGTGGIGKSMMMRHLFLYFAEHFDQYNILPILVSLKNFSEQDVSFEKFIFNSAHDFDHDLEYLDFESILVAGNCLILLDGLDEISSISRCHFDNCLINFTKAYQHNHIVISSRPTSNFIQFDNFLIFNIEPFSKEKALELIDKLDYHDIEAKNKFRNDLNKKLFRSHRQFASNPLLLTIMLMTYTSYGEVPAKRHIFYAKAYETMARLHDASKGAYVRPMHTNLSPEEFAVFFAEFCARTYKAELLEFDERNFTEYMEKVIHHQHIKIDATSRDFLLDLTDNLCIMYKEGDKYYFIHRSFQEYFCAVFFSNQMDDQLERIGDFFENQKTRIKSDRTFDMLYDMIPSRIDRYIFLPFLKRLWEHCDSKDGYLTFLNEMYPTIFAQEGGPGEAYENVPESYLYNFIVNEIAHRHNGELYNIKWPNQINKCNHKEWVSIESERYNSEGILTHHHEVVELNLNNMDYIEKYGTPDVDGISWKISIPEILEQADQFGELITFIEDDSFPLKKEYNDMRKFTECLDKTINNKPNPSDDWFDSF